ncbi:hypothetical protein [Clostridium sp. Marseille-QA1073]
MTNEIGEGIIGKPMSNNNSYFLDGKYGVVTPRDGLNLREGKSTNFKILVF